MKSRKDLIEGEDYYVSEEGYWIFTAKYHLDRGFCCDNNCLNCPYVYSDRDNPKKKKTD